LAQTHDEMICWIDAATYQQLLERWRNAPCGDHMMIGEIGDYFVRVLREKRGQLTHNEQVTVSKRIGWDNA